MSEVTLLSLVQEDTSLQLIHQNEWFGLCPFHGEHTPSFHVTITDQGQVYYCFGCHVGGDAVTYLHEKRQMPMPEAIKLIRGDQPRDQLTYRERQEREQGIWAYWWQENKNKKELTAIHDDLSMALALYKKTVEHPEQYGDEHCRQTAGLVSQLYDKLHMAQERNGYLYFTEGQE